MESGTMIETEDALILKDFKGYTAHRKNCPNNKGALFESLLLEAIKTAFDDGGEDSQGRAKGRRISPKELVDYCASVSELAIEEIKSRNWYTIVPPEFIKP